MKLEDLQPLQEKQEPKGTYAAMKFHPDTIKALRKYMKDNKVPNRIRSEKLHTTLLYSRKHCPNYVPRGDITPPLVGTPKQFHVWDTQDTPPSKCLVLEFDCPDLQARHKELMKEHGATYDFPDYKTHVTLSYNIGDFDIASMSDINEYCKELHLHHEYGEDLNLNWAKDEDVSE